MTARAVSEPIRQWARRNGVTLHARRYEVPMLTDELQAHGPDGMVRTLLWIRYPPTPIAHDVPGVWEQVRPPAMTVEELCDAWDARRTRAEPYYPTEVCPHPGCPATAAGRSWYSMRSHHRVHWRDRTPDCPLCVEIDVSTRPPVRPSPGPGHNRS